MEFSIAVVGHHKRGESADNLIKQVGGDVVAFDPGDVGCELNHIVAWEYVGDSNSEWGVVLEDDAISITDFRQQLGQALKYAPTPVVSLYLGRGRPPHYQDSIAQVISSDASFIVSKKLLSCVGVCIHRDYIPDMSGSVRRRWKWEQRRRPSDASPIDEMMSDWCESLELSVSYTNPSLVQHADGPTLLDFHLSKYKEEDMSSRNERRVAWRMGGRSKWDNSCIALPAPGELILTQVNKWP